jgi:hypothetical protein
MLMRRLRDWRERSRTSDTPIGVLSLDPADLAQKKRSLRFRRGFDDLDYVQFARIRLRPGKTCSLVRHENAPSGGTQVFTSVDSTTPRDDLRDVLAFLGLSPKDVSWRPSSPERVYASLRNARRSQTANPVSERGSSRSAPASPGRKVAFAIAKATKARARRSPSARSTRLALAR